MKRIILCLIILCNTVYAQDLGQYNVTWSSQSANSSESMPCGGGDMGLNVWVENGELLFYIARSGVFDEVNTMPKLGRVRVRLTPNPFEKGGTFRQELKLREGYVEIEGKDTKIKVWVDVFRPVAHVETESKAPVKVEAWYENWRLADLIWTREKQFQGSRGYMLAPDSIKAVSRPDSINYEGNRVVWYHRNRDKTVFDMTVANQGLESVKPQMWNPLKGLTFGGMMEGDNMRATAVTAGKYADIPFKAWGMESVKPMRKHHIKIYVHIDNTPSVEAWRSGLNKIVKEATQVGATAHAKSIAWWNEFWGRGYICINQSKADLQSKAWQVGRNYQLFRYQLGCNAMGKWPTKFNGGLFTFDPCYISKEYSGIRPDHRDWGGGTHTAQNQRLVYWPMLKNGDFEMMKPQLDFYLNMKSNAELRSKVYWGHGGTCFSEQTEQFGLPAAFEYGWTAIPGVVDNAHFVDTYNRLRPANAVPGVEYNQWLEYQWDTSLEFCIMAMQIDQFAGADISKYVPLVESNLEFFFQHYIQLARQRGVDSLDGNGHIIIYPGSSRETYKIAYNPSTTIAALKCAISHLIELPDKYLSPAKREYWKMRLGQVPPIPYRYRNGHKTIAPAEAYARLQNVEIPQLDPVYPYGLFGLKKPELQTAIDTWRYGTDIPEQKDYISWHLDAIYCARLGLAEEAKEVTIKKMADAKTWTMPNLSPGQPTTTRSADTPQRLFPTFWGPGHDWVPDHNWGGSGMIGVQEMLMQTDHEQILLFPSWPKEWDVKFKLYAPYNTIVEGELKDGKLLYLNTTPATRKKDIEIML